VPIGAFRPEFHRRQKHLVPRWLIPATVAVAQVRRSMAKPPEEPGPAPSPAHRTARENCATRRSRNSGRSPKTRPKLFQSYRIVPMHLLNTLRNRRRQFNYQRGLGKHFDRAIASARGPARHTLQVRVESSYAPLRD
jgi:hypothetical protein